MGMLLCGKKNWDVWSRNESVGQKLVKFCTHTHTHTHAAKLVVEMGKTERISSATYNIFPILGCVEYIKKLFE